VGERAFRLAFDLGAGSGRAFLGAFGAAGGVDLQEVHRFHYPPRAREGHLRWEMASLRDGLREGLARGGQAAGALGGRVDSVGVDSWAVDYGLLDEAGSLLEDPVCYRDARTEGEMARVFSRVAREEIFARTGIQFLPLNTLYQLSAHVRSGIPERAARLLLIPDLCHHFLCGATSTERTNASTTQLLDAATGGWADDLIARVGLPRALLPEVRPPGTDLGVLRRELGAAAGLGAVRVMAPATHDTGSAVAGTPLRPGWAYVSSGTWSLVGVEVDGPLLSPAVRDANFTNEGGAQGTVRLLKNVMGLWLLESCRREWDQGGAAVDLAALLGRVAAVTGFAGFVDPDDPRFFSPRSMVGELQAGLRETGQAAHEDPVLLAKVVLDSLALRYASVVRAIEGLTGRAVPGIHVVGGGSRNDYLNQATADASGRAVLAGPVEAAAAGNLLLQAIAGGEVPSLAEGRRLLAAASPPRRFEPRRVQAWEEAARRYAETHARPEPGGR
jgi:rhamnulokinase